MVLPLMARPLGVTLEHWLRWLDRAIPPQLFLGGGHQVMPARALVISSLAATVVSSFTFLVRLLSKDLYGSFVWTNVATIVVSIGLWGLMWRTKDILWPSRIGLSLLGLLLVIRALDDGGINSSSVAWLPMLSMMATMALGWRSGAIAGMLALAALAFVAVSNWFGWEMMAPHASLGQRAASLATLIVMQVVLMMVWARDRLAQETRLESANAALSTTVDALHKRTIEAEELAAMHQRLATVVSHELNTPLNGIVGLSEALLHQTPAGVQHETVASIYHSALLMDSLVRDLLELSRLSSKEVVFVPDNVSLCDLLTEWVEILRPRAEARGLQVRLDCPADCPPVWTDTTRIQQVVVNLLTNAIKFTSKGSVDVALNWKSVGEREVDVVLSVRDTGPGIAKENQERIFARFEQGDANVRRRHGGTGLGLAVVREVVTSMNGSVALSSVVGEGSVFTVRLRLQRFIADAVEEHGGPSVRVLVVDDNPINLLVLEGLLRHLGHTVEAVDSGKEALRWMAHHEVDIVFMDCMMPDMTGWQATRVIRSQGTTVPVIAVTADVTADARAQSLAAGMNDHLTKPIRRERLQRCIARFCHPDPMAAAANRAQRDTRSAVG